MPRLILAAAIRLLNVIRALLLAAGVAGLAATAASWVFTYANRGSGPEWAAPFRWLLPAAIATFLASAVGFAALMPAASDLAADRTSRRASTSPPVAAVLAALALLAALQAPSIAAWWTIDRALLAETLGTPRDPIGLHLIPTVILLSLPALAALALVACVLSSAVGMLARRDRAAVALTACVLLQAGCVGGVWLALRALRRLGETVQSLIDRTSDPQAAAQVSAFLLRHDAPASDASWRLLWILGGYALAIAVAAAVAAGRGGEQHAVDPTLAHPN